KRGLQRMQRAILGQAFDGLDPMTVGLDREHEAGAHRVAVEQHGARPADAVLAADMSSGEVEIVAQEVAQQKTGLDLAPMDFPVHLDRNGDALTHGWPRAGGTITP